MPLKNVPLVLPEPVATGALTSTAHQVARDFDAARRQYLALDAKVAHRPATVEEDRALRELTDELRSIAEAADRVAGPGFAQQLAPDLDRIIEANIPGPGESRALTTGPTLVPALVSAPVIDALPLAGGFAAALPVVTFTGRAVGSVKRPVLKAAPAFETVNEGATITGAPAYVWSSQDCTWTKSMSIFEVSHELLEDSIVTGADVVAAVGKSAGLKLDADAAAALNSTSACTTATVASINIGAIADAISTIEGNGFPVTPSDIAVVVSAATAKAIRTASITATWKTSDFGAFYVSPSLDTHRGYVFHRHAGVVANVVRSTVNLDAAQLAAGLTTDKVTYRAALRHAAGVVGNGAGIVRLEA